MGLFSYIFGLDGPEQPPELTSIYPDLAMQKVYAGILPVIQPNKLVLKQGETCHFVEMAAIITEKTVYDHKRHGASYRIFKGFTYHMGEGKSTPIKEPEYTRGILFFTNQRVVFAASKNGFEMQIKKITAITAYPNGIELQFGSKTFCLLLPDGDVAKQVLKLIM